MPCWLASLSDPFDRPACHIPDDNTSECGAVKGHVRIEYNFPAATGASTTHSGGLILFPNSEVGAIALREDVAGSGLLWAVRDGSNATTNWQVQNLVSYGVTSCQSRVTAMGLRITYTGTELNRAGKYYAGLLPITQFATGNVANVADPLSVAGVPVQAGAAGYSRCYTISNIKNRLIHLSEGRITDGTFHSVWRPAQDPVYVQNSLNPSTVMTLASGTTGPSMYATNGGLRGAQTGQYALVLLAVGDSISSDAIQGNTYSIQMTQHSEVIPDNVTGVTYAVEPSPYDVSAMMSTINAMATSRVATTVDVPLEMSSPGMDPTYVPFNAMGQAASQVYNAIVQSVTPSNMYNMGRMAGALYSARTGFRLAIRN